MKRILVVLTILVWSLSACQNNSLIPFNNLTTSSPLDTTGIVKTSHKPLEIGIVYESLSGDVMVTGDLYSNSKCNLDSPYVSSSSISGSIETVELGITNEVIRCKCPHHKRP